MGGRARWILELHEYDFEIHYNKSLLQVVADALSRTVNIEHEEIAASKEVGILTESKSWVVNWIRIKIG